MQILAKNNLLTLPVNVKVAPDTESGQGIMGKPGKEKSMAMPMKRKLITFLLCSALFFPAWLPAQTVDCYNSTRAQGITLMQQGHYAQAIQVFESAKACPDKPENNDLQAKINQCRQFLEEAQRREENASNARRGYMNITGVRFGNVDYNGEKIYDFGDPLYVSGIKYIKQEVTYDGLATDGEKTIELKMKIIGPDGKIKTGSKSPAGYTWSEKKTIRPGRSHGFTLLGWGNNTPGTLYTVGRHEFEIWYNDNLIYSKEFEIVKDPAVSRLMINGVAYVKGYPLSFSETGGKAELLVSTDAPFWLIGNLPSWCSVSGQTSSGVVIECQENNTTSYRNDVVTIIAGDKKINVEIMQTSAAKSVLAAGGWLAPVRKAVDYVTQEQVDWKYKGTLSFSDKRDGLGVMFWPGRGYYWGHFYDDSRDGEGIYLSINYSQLKNCPDCVYYVGDWTRGKKTGQGRCYDKYGNLLYEGEFTDDKPVGTYPSPEKNATRKFECFVTAKGTYCFCETVNGKKEGLGVQIAKNGDALIVEFKNDIRDGEGLYLYYNNPVTRYGVWKGDAYKPKIRRAGN